MEQIRPTLSSRFGLIEVLERGGKVVQRMEIDTTSITIGRGYTNDLILDDLYVSPEHVRLQLQGDHLVVKDLGSTNGISQKKSHVKGESLSLSPDETFRIGHTNVRFRMTDTDLPATKIDRHLQNSFWSPQNPILVLLAMVALFGFVTMGFLFSQTEQLDKTKVLAELMSTVITILVWAGLWSIFGKIMIDRMSFFTHTGIFVMASLGIYFTSTLLSYIFFAFDFDSQYSTVLTVCIASIIAWMLYTHLRYSTKKTNRTLLIFSLVFTSVVAGFYLLESHISQGEFEDRPSYKVLLKSPDYNFVLGDSLDNFFSETKKMQKELGESLD